MAIPKILSDLSQYFDYYEFESEDTPVICSTVVPNSSAIGRWAAFPKAATPERGRVANGRGMTKNQCQTSGLGEAIELASCCAWNDEDVFEATMDDLGTQAWSPFNLSGFSARQMASRDAWNARNGEFDWCPAPSSANKKIDWMWASGLEQNFQVAVPADFALVGRREAGDEDAIGISDSNGCASGLTIGSAKLSALLELIERDATGRWWYGRQVRRQIPLETLEAHLDFLSALRSRKRKTALFDITTDIAVPTVAAVSWDADGTGLALGFSSAVSFASAALSAAVEMAQIELTVRGAHTAENLPQHLKTWMTLRASDLSVLASPEIAFPLSESAPDTEAEALSWVIERCIHAECRVAFLDLTRSEFGVPTARAIAPNLCHYKPRFGKRRCITPEPADSDLVLLSI